jgi:multidrug efflux pump
VFCASIAVLTFILRTQTNGAVVLLKDVARVERGAESYQTSTRLTNGVLSRGYATFKPAGIEAVNRVTSALTRSAVSNALAPFS